MTRRGQHACVLAGLLICLALTLGLAGSPEPIRKAPVADVPTSDAKSAHPRSPASIVPEGVAVLFVTVIWTACRALLSGRLPHHQVWRVLTTLSRRRSFG